MILLSNEVAHALPDLASRLATAGIEVTSDPRAARMRLLGIGEANQAGPGDMILEFGQGAPSLERIAGSPARLRFGREDIAFGCALIAELARPAARPACADPESARTLDFVKRIAASDASVLVLGETGTGKEGIARYLHSASPRAAGPFTAVNCAALPDTMLEAILFGHRKGSFTGAMNEGEGLFRAADGGTLLLDEVAEIPLPLQAKLLRALQEREVLPVGAIQAEPVDVRVVACANRDLAAAVAAGTFRADLYWRLNVVPIHLRPLAERRMDISAIAAALLLRHVPTGGDFPFPTPAVLDRLMQHRWPGNCRELENVIQRALLLREGDRIEASDLSIDTVQEARPDELPPLGAAARSAEAQVIRAALVETGGHRIRTAERLGISERTLRYRLAEMRAAAA